nr:MAG TPA: hypothetical protein [Caudoviricetes sp.]DAM18301.1 MAG TPA: hypothetical protein [Caudoviricetes sp.]
MSYATLLATMPSKEDISIFQNKSSLIPKIRT